MKKLFLILFLLTSSYSYAQTPILSRSWDFTSISSGNGINIANRPINYHNFNWSVQSGTLSACTIVFESSPDNSSWISQGSSSCTANGNTTLNFVANYIRTRTSVFTVSVAPVKFIINWSGYTYLNLVAGTTFYNRQAGLTGAYNSGNFACSVIQDSVYSVATNVSITSGSTYGFYVAINYTDEANVAQIQRLVNSFNVTPYTDFQITPGYAATDFHGFPATFRCKAGTNFNVTTVAIPSSSFTSVVYSINASIQQLN